MLSRESFKHAIKGIRSQEQFVDEINSVCRKYQMSYFDHDPGKLLQDALLEILSYEMEDSNGYITWWLYEDVEKIISWNEEGHETFLDVTDLDALYDFLVANAKERK